MTRNEAEAAVQTKIDDSSADVSEEVASAVKFLDNYFGEETIDSSAFTTTADQNYISVAWLDVIGLKVGDEPIEKLPDHEEYKFKWFEEQSIKRWIFKNGKIWLTWTPDSEEDCEVMGKKPFALATDDSEFDFPRKLDELVILGATYRYWQNILAIPAQNRENLPDVNAWEVAKLAEVVKKQHDTLLEEIKMEHAI